MGSTWLDVIINRYLVSSRESGMKRDVLSLDGGWSLRHILSRAYRLLLAFIIALFIEVFHLIIIAAKRGLVDETLQNAVANEFAQWDDFKQKQSRSRLKLSQTWQSRLMFADIRSCRFQTNSISMLNIDLID